MPRRGPITGGCDEGSALSLLTRQQDRDLRAKAWRHVRRINAKVARSVWVKHRENAVSATEG
jgi:hypothetical protein